MKFAYWPLFSMYLSPSVTTKYSQCPKTIPDASSQLSVPWQARRQLNGAVQKPQKYLPKSCKHHTFPWCFLNLDVQLPKSKTCCNAVSGIVLIDQQALRAKGKFGVTLAKAFKTVPGDSIFLLFSFTFEGKCCLPAKEHNLDLPLFTATATLNISWGFCPYRQH